MFASIATKQKKLTCGPFLIKLWMPIEQMCNMCLPMWGVSVDSMKCKFSVCSVNKRDFIMEIVANVEKCVSCEVKKVWFRTAAWAENVHLAELVQAVGTWINDCGVYVSSTSVSVLRTAKNCNIFIFQGVVSRDGFSVWTEGVFSLWTDEFSICLSLCLRLSLCMVGAVANVWVFWLFLLLVGQCFVWVSLFYFSEAAAASLD